MEEKVADSAAVLQAKEKTFPPSNFTDNNVVYRLELTVSQANAISSLLPKNYSINLDRSVKPKRNVKKLFSTDFNSKEPGSQPME